MIRQSIFYLSTLLLLSFFSVHQAVAQSGPAVVIQGPEVSVDVGCANDILDSNCVTIDYDQGDPTSAAILQKRLVQVPRGNLLFHIPVSSTVPGTSRIHTSVVISVIVTVKGPNGELVQNSAGKLFHTFGSAMLQIPINIDWAVSTVTFHIQASAVQSGLCGNGCLNGSGEFNGPDLSAVNLGLTIPSELFPSHAFVLVETPAAAFQLPILPTTIVYAPLGNGPLAASSFTVTNITATNEAFTSTNDVTTGITHDDKTQFSWGIGLSLGVSNSATDQGCSMGTNCVIAAGFKKTGTWDKSVEDDHESTFATTESVASQFMNSQQHTATPRPGQPPLDQLTAATQPFWMDKILAVTNPQFAVWDYPAGPVIQPLGSAQIVELPILQLDACSKGTNAIEPAFITPLPWVANQAYAVNTLVLDSNHMIQIVTTAGTSGSATPTWNQTEGGLTTDGNVTWKNQEGRFGIYRGSVTLDVPQYLSLTTWAPGQAYPQGTVIKLGNSVEVATTGGTSGGTIPTFNTANEATTTDGTVTWTNEQDHFVTYAGPVLQRQTVFQWLTSAECGDIASLDQFYVNKSQSASPLSYRLLGSGGVSPASGTTFSSSQQTISSTGQSSTFKHTVKVTHITTAEENLSASLDAGLKVAWAAIGLSGSVSRTKDHTTTITNTTMDSSELQKQVTTTGVLAVSTTIQDNGNEQSIPINVMQDSIFGGIAVQDTDIHLNSSIIAHPPISATASLPTGQSTASDSEIDAASQPQAHALPTAEETKAQLQALHEEAARRHIPRDIPDPGPATVRDLSPQEMLRILTGVKSPKAPLARAIKSLQTQVQVNSAK